MNVFSYTQHIHHFNSAHHLIFSKLTLEHYMKNYFIPTKQALNTVLFNSDDIHKLITTIVYVLLVFDWGLKEMPTLVDAAI